MNKSSNHIIKQKILLAAEKRSLASIDAMFVETIISAISKVFLEILSAEVKVKINESRFLAPDVALEKPVAAIYGQLILDQNPAIICVNTSLLTRIISGILTSSSPLLEKEINHITLTDTVLLTHAISAILNQVFSKHISPTSANDFRVIDYKTEKTELVYYLDDKRYAYVDLAIDDSAGISWGNIQLILPLATLETVSNKLEPSEQTRRKERWETQISHTAESVDINLKVVLENIDCPLNEVLNLSIGQKIELPEANLNEIRCTIPSKAGDKAISLGQLGSIRSKKAFRVSNWILEK